jgi:hypothetical protein
LLARLGVEDRSDQRGEHRLLLLARVPERLAEEMDGAALPRRAEHLADRVLQSFVRVGDDQLHAGQATLDQAAEEVAPERLRLRFAAVEADHLAPTRLVHAVRDLCVPEIRSDRPSARCGALWWASVPCGEPVSIDAS